MKILVKINLYKDNLIELNLPNALLICVKQLLVFYIFLAFTLNLFQEITV